MLIFLNFIKPILAQGKIHAINKNTTKFLNVITILT